MKFRLTQWEDGNGKKHWTVEVKGLIFWSHIGYDRYYCEHPVYSTFAAAMNAIDWHVANERKKRIRPIHVEYVTK